MTKVLILDQSKSVRNILRERLEYEGFSAEAVENEAAASALCERIPFDVILSDTECKVPDAGIPFIALSADTSIDTAVKAVRNGAQDFLTKPIDMNRLLQSLHRTIDNPASAQAPPAAPPVRRRRAKAVVKIDEPSDDAAGKAAGDSSAQPAVKRNIRRPRRKKEEAETKELFAFYEQSLF